MDDTAIRRLIQTIKSGAYVLSAHEIAMFHDLIGERNLPKAALEWDRRTVLQRASQMQGYGEWEHRLPGFNFPQGWKVVISPPSGGVLIRFKIFYNDKAVEVSFVNGEIFGSLNSPGWVLYAPEEWRNQPHWLVTGIGEFRDSRFAENCHHDMIEAIKKEFKSKLPKKQERGD